MSAIIHAHLHAAQQTAYLADAIADELLLAQLLGYADIEAPTEITPNCWIWASRGKEFASVLGHTMASLGRIPLPRWRRGWEGAGELIAPCLLDVRTDAKGACGIWSGGSIWVDWNHHPDRDSALFYVISKAAIAHLSERAA